MRRIHYTPAVESYRCHRKMTEDKDKVANRILLLVIALILILVIWMIALYKGYSRDLDDPRSDYNSQGQCP